MSALDRLYRVRRLRYDYRRLVMKIEELETIAERTVPSISQTPGVHSGNKSREDTWTMLMDYKAECEDKLRDYITQSKELEAEIDLCVNSERIKTALKARFVDGLTVAQISEATNYTERQVFRFLKTGENLYCERYRDD